MIGNHNPESSFCQKCEVFGGFFIAIAKNVPSDCSQNCGTPEFKKKCFLKGSPAI